MSRRPCRPRPPPDGRAPESRGATEGAVPLSLVCRTRRFGSDRGVVGEGRKGESAVEVDLSSLNDHVPSGGQPALFPCAP